MKLTIAQRRILTEALRRYFMQHDYYKDLEMAWTGLGARSYMKPVTDAGLMCIVVPCPPRTTCWWRLTKKGAAIVQHWIDLGWTQEHANRGYLCYDETPPKL